MLTVACLGVLKLNGLPGEKDRARERPSTATLFAIGETKTGLNSMPPTGFARVRRVDPWMVANPPNAAGAPYGSRSEGSNHIDCTTMDQLKNRK